MINLEMDYQLIILKNNFFLFSLLGGLRHNCCVVVRFVIWLCLWYVGQNLGGIGIKKGTYKNNETLNSVIE